MRGQAMFGSAWYHDPYWGETTLVRSAEDLDKCRALVLWGGEDVSPALYGQKPYAAMAGPKPSQRDMTESMLVKEAHKRGIPILGVCRGAQLLCCLAGGKLWQHVDGHVSKHNITIHTTKLAGQSGPVTSTHHQMMVPPEGAEIIATSEKVLSPYKWGESWIPELNVNPEPEIVWFPNIGALAVQGHPEYMSKDSWFASIVRQIFEEKTNGIYAWR